MSDHVTAGEFERTTERLFAQLDRIESKHDRIRTRVDRLEHNQEAAGKISMKLSAGVSVIVAAIIQGVLAAVNPKA